MIRNLLVFIVIVIVYYSLKTVLRSAFKAYHEEHNAPAQLKGEEMVLDPECRTYVIKGRALTGASGKYSFAVRPAREYEKTSELRGCRSWNGLQNIFFTRLIVPLL
jgi:hypothetical protein